MAAGLKRTSGVLISLAVLTAGCVGGRLDGDGDDAGLGEASPKGRADEAVERDVALACSKLAQQRMTGDIDGALDEHASLEWMLGCIHPNSGDAGWPEEPSSTVASAGWVGKCLDVRGEQPPNVVKGLPSYAVCGSEGRALSRAAFLAEVEHLRLSAGARARALAYFGQLEKALAVFEAEVAEKAVADITTRSIFHDEPDAAWREAEAYRAGAVERAAVTRFERAYLKGRSAVAGCATELRDVLVAPIKKGVDRDYSAIELSMGPTAQPVARALMACARMLDQPELAHAIERLRGRKEAGGGRRLAYQAVVDEIARSRTPAAIELGNGVKRMAPPVDGGYRQVSTVPFDSDQIFAQVGAVKRQGRDVLVSFKPREPGDERRPLKPVLVAADYADELEAERQVHMYCNELSAEPQRCFPVLVIRDKKSRQLVAFLGARL